MKILAYILLTILAIVGPSLLASCIAFMPQKANGQTYSKPVLYIFTSQTCGQCQLDKPTISKISRSGYCAVVTVDADNRTDLVSAYRVTNLPDYLVFVNGQLYYRTHDVADLYRIVPR